MSERDEVAEAVLGTLLGEAMATVVTITWPTWADDPTGIGGLRSGSTSKEVPALLYSATLRGPYGTDPASGEIHALVAALDRNGIAIPPLTTDCQVALADGRLLAVVSPGPFPSDGEASFYEPTLSAGGH